MEGIIVYDDNSWDIKSETNTLVIQRVRYLKFKTGRTDHSEVAANSAVLTAKDQYVPEPELYTGGYTEYADNSSTESFAPAGGETEKITQLGYFSSEFTLTKELTNVKGQWIAGRDSVINKLNYLK